MRVFMYRYMIYVLPLRNWSGGGGEGRRWGSWKSCRLVSTIAIISCQLEGDKSAFHGVLIS